MKRATILSIAISMIACVTNANVSFRWSNATANTALTDGGGALAVGSTVLLFISTDSTINFDSGVQLTSNYGNDTFLGATPTISGGRYNTASQVFGVDGGSDVDGSYVGQFTYMVLVDQAYTVGMTPANVAIGKHYAVSSMSPKLTQFDNQDPPATAQPFADTSTLNNNIGDAAGVMRTSLTNVPEPSTMALVGVGIGLLALRRKFMK